MPDYTTIAQRYLDVFNETDAGRRDELLRALYADDCRYVDPNVDVGGIDGIEGFIAATQDRFPGISFTLGGTVDGHHDQLRFQWHAGDDGAGGPAFVGFDVLALDGRERVSRVYGFVDRVPQG